MNFRLLCPAPAKATTASKCSCLAPVHGRQFDIRKRRYLRFATTLFSPSTSGFFVPTSSPRCTRCLSSFYFFGMCTSAQASGNQCCCPQRPVFCRARRSSSNQSLEGFADGSSGCEGTRALSPLFFGLRLYLLPFRTLLAGSLPAAGTLGAVCSRETMTAHTNANPHGDDRCINSAQSLNVWVIGVDFPNTRRLNTPRRTNKQTHTSGRKTTRDGAQGRVW